MGINKGTENIDTSNIFEEFEVDSSHINEKNQGVRNEKKDVYDYFKSAISVFKNVILLMFLLYIFLYGYIYIQQNEEIQDNKFIEPICYIFSGDIPMPKINGISGACSSIANLKKIYSNDKTMLVQEQVRKMLLLISDIYAVENFNKSKEMVFLLTKTENRLKGLQIIDAFDVMKNEYEPLEKQKIQCLDIVLNEDNELQVTCEAYSTGFEKRIIGYEAQQDNYVSGSSISIATSFLNYIEKQSKSFTIIDKDKTYKLERVVGENTGFTNKTTFNFTLKYQFNSLSF